MFAHRYVNTSSLWIHGYRIDPLQTPASRKRRPPGNKKIVWLLSVYMADTFVVFCVAGFVYFPNPPDNLVALSISG